jgi:hypothetical protein
MMSLAYPSERGGKYGTGGGSTGYLVSIGFGGTIGRSAIVAGGRMVVVLAGGLRR